MYTANDKSSRKSTGSSPLKEAARRFEIKQPTHRNLFWWRPGGDPEHSFKSFGQGHFDKNRYLSII
jgi:hypothetical protein